MNQKNNSTSTASTSKLTSSSRVYTDEPLAITNLKKIIIQQLKLNYQPAQQLIILCIGTDRSTGDALGPLVGSKLKKFQLTNVDLFGTLENPVHATNLEEKINIIQQQYTNPFIIAIDAGLGKKRSVGAIDVKPGPLQPGSGVDKDLPAIGDLQITGLVNISGYMEYLVLQSTRLNLVLKMSRKIAYSMVHGLKKLVP